MSEEDDDFEPRIEKNSNSSPIHEAVKKAGKKKDINYLAAFLEQHVDSICKKEGIENENQKIAVLKSVLNSQNDFKRRTPLMLACFHGYREVVKFLLQKGADISITDMNNKRAIDIANYEIVPLLEKHLNSFKVKTLTQSCVAKICQILEQSEIEKFTQDLQLDPNLFIKNIRIKGMEEKR